MPTPNVSVVDLKIVAKRATDRQGEINAAMKRAAEQQVEGHSRLHQRAERLDRLQPRPAFLHRSTMDQTQVQDGTLVRVMSWYDNEWGFSNRMADTAVAMGKLL